MIMTSLIKKSRIQTNGRGKVYDIFKGMVVKTIFFQFFIINDDSILNNWVIVLEILTDHNFFLSFGLIKYFFFEIISYGHSKIMTRMGWRQIF